MAGGHELRRHLRLRDSDCRRHGIEPDPVRRPHGLQRLAALVPRPRLHLIRYHGVLAPNARLRPLVVPQKPEVQERAAEVAVAGGCDVQTVQSRPCRVSWARLLKRVFDIDMQHCPNCGAGELKIIAAILERQVIEKILGHLGLDPQPPPKGRAREAGLHFVA